MSSTSTTGIQADQQAAVIGFLQHEKSYPHPVKSINHLQTHASHIFLTGEFAYKIKKPVKFDFLDFSSLDKRKHFCEEELRLNSRYAPDLYLEVVPISRYIDENGKSVLHFGAVGQIVEYAIKMRQFEATFDQLVEERRLSQSLLLEISDIISKFHSSAQLRPGYWEADEVVKIVKRNLTGCADCCSKVLDANTFERLNQLTERELLRHRPLMKRRQSTHVRELHGDLHLRNMCVYHGRAELFDGLEFNPHLSNCDVWADLSFLTMDLINRGLGKEAALVWNRYLQNTDDFEGLQLHDLYASHRAAIRSRTSCLAIESAGQAEKAELTAKANQYLDLALRLLEPRSRGVIAVGGLSGTGKTTLSSLLAQHLLAVHVRSDAVRKHICGVPLTMPAPPEAYSEEMNRRTLAGMLERGQMVLESGRPLILDAVFHSSVWRSEVESLAKKFAVPFVGFWCELPQSAARERIRQRKEDISDADTSVSEVQQSYYLGELDWIQINTSGGKHQTLTSALAKSPDCRRLEKEAAALIKEQNVCDPCAVSA